MPSATITPLSRFEDEVLVRLLVEKKGTRSLTYQFRFYRLKGTAFDQVAQGRLTAVCAARQEDGSLKAVAIPRVLADKIQAAPPELLADGAPPPERPVSPAPAESSRRRLRRVRRAGARVPRSNGA